MLAGLLMTISPMALGSSKKFQFSSIIATSVTGGMALPQLPGCLR
tara:strand:+ start:1315 stop:1449 length:135 start_codon:yes stop_codon:yes gene_type:complete